MCTRTALYEREIKALGPAKVTLKGALLRARAPILATLGLYALSAPFDDERVVKKRSRVERKESRAVMRESDMPRARVCVRVL